MTSISPFEIAGPVQAARMGDVMVRRGAAAQWVVYLDQGRASLGLLDGDKLEHQLGAVQGPTWLDVNSAVLGLPSLVDIVAQTDVNFRRVSIASFRKSVSELPVTAQGVMRDLALAHRQQTELAVSRLVKDAEARCAEWMLRHAEQVKTGIWQVPLTQRKRLIAAQLGIAPETLSRVLRQLRDRGLIAGTGRTLNVLQPTALRTLAGL